MSLNAFRAAADAGRRAAASVGMRPVTVTIIHKQYSLPVGTQGRTLLSETSTTLSPSPKVQRLTDTLSAFGGGSSEAAGGPLVAETYVIGPITPSFDGGGYSVSDLAPTQTDTTHLILVALQGDEFGDGETFGIESIDASHPLHYTMVVRRVTQSGF